MLIAKIEFTSYSRETLITTRMRFDFEAEDKLTTEGDWTPSDPASAKLSRIYFDDVGGWWRWHKDPKGERHFIDMLEHKDPGGIEVVWTRMPKIVAVMNDVGRLPFEVGNFGSGNQFAPPKLYFQWSVIGV